MICSKFGRMTHRLVALVHMWCELVCVGRLKECAVHVHVVHVRVLGNVRSVIHAVMHTRTDVSADFQIVIITTMACVCTCVQP
jgi:hypothetical protein